MASINNLYDIQEHMCYNKVRKTRILRTFDFKGLVIHKMGRNFTKSPYLFSFIGINQHQ
ncbi:hypothetical protein D3C76_1862620 [compost metagenome]